MRSVAPQERESGFVTLSTGTVGSAKPEDAKNYLDRVRAYVPLEVVAFFIFANSLVLGRVLQNEVAIKGKPAVLVTTVDGYVAIATLVIGAVATLVYANLAAKTAGRDTWYVQAAVSLVAFFIWAYAIGARALELTIIPVVPSVAGLLLATFTLFSGLIVPVKQPATPAPAVP